MVERIEYQNADGSFVMKEDSKHKKAFRQKRPNPDCPGEWIWNIDGIPPLVYRLPEVTEAIASGHEIIITEGEAKADLLWSWNIPATCCSQGAGKWKAEHSDSCVTLTSSSCPTTTSEAVNTVTLSVVRFLASQAASAPSSSRCRRRATSSIGRRQVARSTVT